MTLREALLRGRRRPRRFGAGSPTSYRGDGYEFVELRAYVPGDDVRRIDWAATARAGDLQTRVVLEDVALTLAAVLDDSPSMRVGRARALIDAAREACETWFAAASAGDRCLRVAPDHASPPYAPVTAAFDLRRSLQTARAALPRGCALLVASDWFALHDDDDALLVSLARAFDCTALVARDPWYDGLPLQGIVRLRGADGGSLRAYIGRRERAAFAAAVRERDAKTHAMLQRCGWRTGTLREEDGTAALAGTFGLHAIEARRG
ncbi:MAG: DUF58 domain-containing protein [bacterium]|nr:DUF58 domain-containing protein [bacterium]